jgi:glycosyltransferase involved in cell wall biosynthesis
MLSSTSFQPELGGGRVQLEIGQELQELGHEVEFLGPEEVLAGESPRLRPLRFARRARGLIQARAGDWDVIDVDHGDLPYSKRELGFNGLLVARSVGLYAFYRDYKRLESARWDGLRPGSSVGRAIETYTSRRGFEAAERCLRSCDLAMVPTEDERRYLLDRGIVREVCALPFGLTEQQHARFVATAQPAEARRRSRTVAYVGSWGLRKGRADWPAIVSGVRREVPEARFLFLGTGVSEEAVRLELAAAVSVIPAFASAELPRLLADATVGAFPSYAEGFGFGVLEMLAAGLPTVAYDVSGPRRMLGSLATPLPAPGDVAGFTDALVGLLQLDAERYASLSGVCAEASRAFRWTEIARRTAEAYEAGLAKL